MLLVAIWHGSQLTFLIWGLLHAFYMVVLMLLPPHLRRPPKTNRSFLVRMVITFLLVNFAWIFFRAASFEDSIFVVTHLFSFDGNQDFLTPFRQSLWLFEAPVELLLSLFLIVLLFAADWLSMQNYTWESFPRPVRWAGYYALLTGIYLSQLFLSLETQQFIYRQF
jgi:D-alanyl-lipoteichoic acid acyltransferase DltB (MBOAT superfamily)